MWRRMWARWGQSNAWPSPQVTGAQKPCKYMRQALHGGSVIHKHSRAISNSNCSSKTVQQDHPRVAWQSFVMAILHHVLPTHFAFGMLTRSAAFLDHFASSSKSSWSPECSSKSGQGSAGGGLILYSRKCRWSFIQRHKSCLSGAGSVLTRSGSLSLQAHPLPQDHLLETSPESLPMCSTIVQGQAGQPAAGKRL